MARRVVPVTRDNLDDLPQSCRSCVFWEVPSGDRARAEQFHARAAAEKETWVSTVLLEWGSCGRLVYVDRVPAGYVLFAPPVYVARAAAFATAPVSSDAVLLVTGYVLPEYRGAGLGRVLVQSVAKDLIRRNVRAIEAFGDLAWTGPSCVLPAEHLLAVGFKTVRPHRRFPRMRLDLKTTVSWREDVEVALERLLGSMSPERALRPV